MEVTIEVKSLTHDDLVNLFSTALYGDATFEVSVKETEKHLTDKCWNACESQGLNYCFEDMLADHLLLGGTLIVEDCLERDDPSNENQFQYEIDLKKVLEGCTKDYNDARILLVEEEGDFYNAYNLLQTIVFGSVVYG